MDQDAILKRLKELAEPMMGFCSSGVHTADDYEQSLEIVDLLRRINKPTAAQRLSLESLVLVVGDYEEKHYPIGN